MQRGCNLGNQLDGHGPVRIGALELVNLEQNAAPSRSKRRNLAGIIDCRAGGIRRQAMNDQINPAVPDS